MGICTISEYLCDQSYCRWWIVKCLTLDVRKMRITSILIVEVPPGLMVFSSAGTSSPCKRSLSLTWDLLIFRYIFMNMFTGVVVESFAYVYQRPGGVSVNREELSQSSLQFLSLNTEIPRSIQESLVIHWYWTDWVYQAERLHSLLLSTSFQYLQTASANA